MRDSSIEDELASALQDSIEPLRSLLKQALRVRMLLLHVIRRAEVTEFANSICQSAHALAQADKSHQARRAARSGLIHTCDGGVTGADKCLLPDSHALSE
jgi:hypothetical protein